MKLASLDNGSRDGSLVVVRSDGQAFVDAFDAAPTMRELIDDWHSGATELRQIGQRLELGATPALDVDLNRLLPPLPRIHGWIDGAQGEPGQLLGPRATVLLPPSASVVVRPDLMLVMGDVPPTGTQPGDAYVRLLLLALAVEVQGVPAEPGSTPCAVFRRPATAFAPFGVSPEYLETHVDAGVLHLGAALRRNEVVQSTPDTGDGFSIRALVELLRGSRVLTGGVVVSTGALPCDPVELAPGDCVDVEVIADGRSMFGRASVTRA